MKFYQSDRFSRLFLGRGGTRPKGLFTECSGKADKEVQMEVVISVGLRRRSPPLTTSKGKTSMGDVRRPKGSRTKARSTRHNKISSLQRSCVCSFKGTTQLHRKKGQGHSVGACPQWGLRRRRKRRGMLKKSLAGCRASRWSDSPVGSSPKAKATSDVECAPARRRPPFPNFP